MVPATKSSTANKGIKASFVLPVKEFYFQCSVVRTTGR
jgi:hypothetical protein